MIDSKNDLFDMVDILSQERPFEPNKIENITDHSLEHIKDESNEYFLIYRSQNKNDQRNDDIAIELRVPKSKSSSADGILVLNIEKGICIDQEDIVQKFGLGEPSPPHPDMPKEEALFYLSYNYEWGQISYGFRVINQKCLSSIVLDATLQ